MSVEYMSFTRDLVVETDGYDSRVSTLAIREVVVQVTGDDTATWKLQGTLDGSRWYDLDGAAGSPSIAVNSAPQQYTVDKYSKVRLWVSNTALSYVVSIKGISN